MSLNVRVREIRKYLRLTQVEFSSKLGLKQGSIADWERGKSTPSIETLTNIADNFNINLHWLLTGKGEMFLSDNKEDQEKRVDNNELINLRRRYDQLEKVCNDLKKSIDQSEKKCSILSNKNQELNQELFTRLRELLECKDLIIKLQKNNC